MEIVWHVWMPRKEFHALHGNICTLKELPIGQHHAWNQAWSVEGLTKRGGASEECALFGELENTSATRQSPLARVPNIANCPRREYLKREVFNSKKEERDSVKVFVKGEFTKKGKYKRPRKTGGTTRVKFSEPCSCNLRNLGKSRLGSPIPLGASPFGQLGRRVRPHFGEDLGNFDELSRGHRTHSAHRRTSTQITKLPCPFVEFGESIFKLASLISR